MVIASRSRTHGPHRTCGAFAPHSLHVLSGIGVCDECIDTDFDYFPID